MKQVHVGVDRQAVMVGNVFMHLIIYSMCLKGDNSALYGFVLRVL